MHAVLTLLKGFGGSFGNRNLGLQHNSCVALKKKWTSLCLLPISPLKVEPFLPQNQQFWLLSLLLFPIKILILFPKRKWEHQPLQNRHLGQQVC